MVQGSNPGSEIFHTRPNRPSFLDNGYRVSCPGGWEWGSGPGMALTTHTSSAEVKERVELYLYFPSGPSLPVVRLK